MSTPTTLIADRYRLVKMLGSGGMGVVWHAWDERLHRPVALKMLRSQPEVDESERGVSTERAMREARITAGLHHPHAVTVFDVIEHEGRPCIVMQLIDSTPLSALLKEHGPMTPSQAARIGGEVASALAAAHKLRIVHRDVKPGNILITADGSALISDFGISHALGDTTITATGLIHGTPAYLAPEVAKGLPTSFASDVFSLGSTMYTMLEGTPPFGTDSNAISLLHKVARGGYTPPRRAGPLAPLLKQMLATNPKRRPTMPAVAEALASWQRDAGHAAVFPDGVAILTAMLRDDQPGSDFTGATTEALIDVPPPRPPLPPPPPQVTTPASEAAAAGTAAVAAPSAEAAADAAAAGAAAVAAPLAEADAASASVGAGAPELVDEPPPSPETPDAAAEPADEAADETRENATGSVTVAAAAAATAATAPTIPADQPTRFEPQTGETERLAPAAVVSQTAETVPVSSGPPRASSAPPAPPTAPAPAQAPGSAPERRRRTGLIAGILVLVGALVLGAAAFFNPWRSPVDDAASSSPPPVAATSEATQSAEPESDAEPAPPAPSESAPAPVETPAQPQPEPPPPAPVTSEQRVADTISTYYAMLPGDLDAAWPYMTADYQENHAGGRGGYEAFWSNVASLEIADVSATAPDRGQATLTYHFRDGRVVQEVTSYRLVDEGGVLKIAETDVLSSVRL